MALKVCTQEGTSPFKQSPEESTRRVGLRDLSHEQFTRSVLKNKSLGLVPKIQTGLNSWDLSQGPKLVPATRFRSKNGQFTRCDQSQGLVPSCVPPLTPIANPTTHFGRCWQWYRKNLRCFVTTNISSAVASCCQVTICQTSNISYVYLYNRAQNQKRQRTKES